MWVTPDGVQHSISLPDPTEVVTGRALASYAALIGTADRDELEVWLDDRLLALHDATFEPDIEGLFFERAPDVGLLDGDLSTYAGLDAALSGVDPRWQVDLVFALRTILDAVDRDDGPTA
jgi:hypothetical protein